MLDNNFVDIENRTWDSTDFIGVSSDGNPSGLVTLWVPKAAKGHSIGGNQVFSKSM